MNISGRQIDVVLAKEHELRRLAQAGDIDGFHRVLEDRQWRPPAAPKADVKQTHNGPRRSLKGTGCQGGARKSRRRK